MLDKTLFLISVILAIIFAIFTILDDSFSTKLHNIVALVAMIISSYVFALTIIYMKKELPAAYRVAVIGFPRSGKTTLITALFGELFANRLGIKAIPRGLETTERINANLEKLEIGKSIGSTTDQDVFAYRIDVIRGKSIFERRYKVEIGDFPGEDSATFTEKFGSWFHQTPYFKWAMEADAFLFIIDLTPALVKTNEQTPEEYVAKMTSAIRAAWQRLNEYHYEGNTELSQKPVILVFTKTDLFGIATEKTDLDETTTEILKLGFDEIPKPTDIDPKKLEQGKKQILKQFSTLIQFLKKQSNNFECIFVSCFSYEEEQRVGIKELLNKMLPK